MRFGIMLLIAAGLFAFWYGQRWLKHNPQAWGALLNGLWVSALVGVTLFLLARGNTTAIFLLLGVGLPLAQSWYRAWQQVRQAQGGAHSRLSTRFLHIVIDHATGAMHGRVIAGTAQGHSLDTLGLTQLLALLREYQASDADSARLLAAYLDQQHPHWRASAPPPQSAMNREQARAVLGVPPDATPEDIRAAHRRLIQRLHPDRGGSDYLAAQINQAKDMLLGK